MKQASDLLRLTSLLMAMARGERCSSLVVVKKVAVLLLRSQLRSPAESKLAKVSGADSGTKPSTVQVAKEQDGGYAGPSRIEGTMIFKDVCTSGQMSFVFGRFGYGELKMTFGEELPG